MVKVGVSPKNEIDLLYCEMIYGYHYAPETFKMLKFDDFTANPILRENSNFSVFRRSKNVIFGNFRDSEF